MSSKRYLLSLALLFAAVAGIAQIGFWANTDVMMRTGDPNAWGLAVRAGMNSPIDDISSFEVTDYLDWWNYRQDNRKQKFNNRLLLGYYYQDQGLSWGAAYNATLIGGSEAIRINYEWVDMVPDVLYRKKLAHQGNIDVNYAYKMLEAGAEVNMRLLQADPVQLWGDPIEGLDSYLFDNYSRAELALRPLKGLRVHTAYDYKVHPMDEALAGRTLDYDYNAFEMGAAWEQKIGYNAHLSLSETWQNRDWDSMMPEHRNQLISEMRLGYHLNPDIYAFCSYVNRSCFADMGEPVYLLANYARAQLQYSFPADPTAGSYVLVGAKIRPANDSAFHPDTSAYFGELDYAVAKAIYLGARVNLAPEIQDEYRARISYHVDPNSELHFEYIGRQTNRASIADQDYHSFIGMGTEVHF